MSDFVIEKNIPIPPRKYATEGPRGVKTRWPFKDMEVGDSIFIPYEDSRADQAIVAAWGCKKRTGFVFLSRRQRENGVYGIRIWRVAGEYAKKKLETGDGHYDG